MEGGTQNRNATTGSSRGNYYTNREQMYAFGLSGDMSKAMFKDQARASVEDGSEGGLGRGSESRGVQNDNNDYTVLRASGCRTLCYTHSLHPLTCADRKFMG